MLSGCSSDPIIGSVDGEPIHNSDYLEALDYYLSMYGLESGDYTSESAVYIIDAYRDSLLEQLALQQVAFNKAKELGFDQLSTEQQTQLEESFNETMNAWIEAYKTQAEAENPGADDAAITEAANQLFNKELEAIGFTRESYEQRIRDDLKNSIVIQRLYDETTAEATISESELQDTYETRIEEAREIYADDPSAFEADFISNDSIVYIPAGYRQIKHILIGFDAQTASEIQTLRTEGNDEEADAKRAEALKGIEEEAQSVLKSLKSDGSNFDQVMKEKTDDPGIESAPEGYAVCDSKESSFDQTFVKAAFALKKQGAISGLVATDSGYHILYYYKDLAEGPLSLDTCGEALEAELLESKKQNMFNDLLSQWYEDADVVLDAARITYPKPKTTPSASAAASPTASQTN